MAGKLPDAIIASPLGLQCPAFLNELANAKTQAAGWAPMVFLTNTCASKLFLGLAGTAAEGVYTSSNLLDANDPKNANAPGVKTFLETGSGRAITRRSGCRSKSAGTPARHGRHLERRVEDRNAQPQIDHPRAARTLTFHSVTRPTERAVQDEAATLTRSQFQTLQVLQWSAAVADLCGHRGSDHAVSRADHGVMQVQELLNDLRRPAIRCRRPSTSLRSDSSDNSEVKHARSTFIPRGLELTVSSRSIVSPAEW
jgi:hypothetical protein